MSQHHATVSWQPGDGGFKRGRFSRVHEWHFDGGLVIPASASPAVIPPPYSEAGAIDPEEAFVASLASCHMMSFLFLANREGLEIVAYRDEASGELATDSAGAKAITTVTLRPQVEIAVATTTKARDLEALHDQAHELCFIANSVLSTIIIEPVHAT